MTIEIKTVKGYYIGNDADGRLEWACPISGSDKSAWGQFNIDEYGNVEHDVRDEDDNILYIVVA